MIKYSPDFFIHTDTMKPLPKRRHGSDRLELFVMARRRQSSPAPYHVLFACTPETRANPAGSPWQMKTACFQQQHKEQIQEWAFQADVAFSYKGKGFWADLSQGLVYCDLHATSDPAVDFGFIPLPPCQRNLAQMELDDMAREWCTMETEPPMKVTQTVACVGDSIWFVCIHRATEYAQGRS
ncbi:unnamed protein product [Urochloa humidicola]